MRETVFKKALSLLLCAVLLLGVLPLDSHAEGSFVTLSAEQRQAVVNRQMDDWYFPLPEEFFDNIVDFAGCRGANEDILYGTANYGCTQEDHADLPWGNEALMVNVSSTQPVYAPASGMLYRSSAPDQLWGDVAVLEVPVDTSFSYYILMGSVSADAAVASGSYVEAGTVIGYTAGTFCLAAVMDNSGYGVQISDDVAEELDFAGQAGWLTEFYGVGLVCVNPSSATSTQYPNSMVYDHAGPITYRFVPAQQTVQPTEATTEAHTDHQWDGGTVAVPATHTTEGV